MPNWLTKRNKTELCSEITMIMREFQQPSKAKAFIFIQNDDPPSALDFRSSAVQLESNCGSCRAVITTVPVEQFMTVVPVGQLAAS